MMDKLSFCESFHLILRLGHFCITQKVLDSLEISHYDKWEKNKMPYDPELKARGKLARTLSELRDMLPGSFIERQRRCRKPNCRCAKGKHLHTQYQLSVLWDGKPRTFHIPAEMAEEVRRNVNMYKRFQLLAAEICEINLRRLLKRKKEKP
jgi:hypothetical protein